VGLFPPSEWIEFSEAAFGVTARTEGHHYHAYFIINGHFLHVWFGVCSFLFQLRWILCVDIPLSLSSFTMYMPEATFT
jgi:hypothetical protein